MKISACLVTVSLIANLVLASIWLNRRSSRTLQSNPHSEGLNSQAESAISKMDRSKVETFETVAAIGSEPLTWKQLESSDLKGFIRHLRAVGCPEETVQDLVLAQALAAALASVDDQARAQALIASSLMLIYLKLG